MEKIVEPALSSKFLQENCATSFLYTSILSLIQQRILHLLATGIPKLKSFDESLDPSKSNTLRQNFLESPLPEAVWSEIQDLVEDWLEMSTTMEEGLAKEKGKAAQTARSLIVEHRAIVMEHIMLPIRNSPSFSSQVPVENGVDEVSKALQKAARLQNPANPDTQLSYILHYFLKSSLVKAPMHPSDVAIRLCHVRFLFQRALQFCGPVDDSLSTLFQRDYQTSLRNLCEEWLQFERRFGSMESLKYATKTAQRKIEKLLQSAEKASGKKRDAHEALGEESPAEMHFESEQSTKRAKSLPEESKVLLQDSQDPKRDSSPDSAEESRDKTKPKLFHVVVGNMKYPAHPFTIRVFDLSEDVEDMDLVDLFQASKAKCGNIVFARILRDRSGKSKGWGLVQFEERESVEEALKLSETIGVKGKLIKVQRSHMPAVLGLVPTGKQRVNPLGEGKASKRNAKWKERKKSATEDHVGHEPPDEKPAPSSSPAPGMLSLVPRGARGRGPRKRL